MPFSCSLHVSLATISTVRRHLQAEIATRLDLWNKGKLEVLATGPKAQTANPQAGVNRKEHSREQLNSCIGKNS